MKYYILILFLFLIKINCLAQGINGIQQSDSVTGKEMEEGLKTSIGLIARSYTDSVILRWAVSKPAVWNEFKEFGIILERAPLSDDGTYGRFRALESGAFKPWTEEQWAQYFNNRPVRDTTRVDYEAHAYLFGSEKEDNSYLIFGNQGEGDIQNIKERKSQRDWQLLFAMLSANSSRTAAEGLGLRYTDKNIKKGEKYVYRAFLAGRSSVYKVDTGYVKVTVERFNPDFARQEIQASENDGSILLNWMKNTNLTFYNIERSDDNGKTFKRLNKIPLLTMRPSDDLKNDFEGYLDTLIVNYRPYLYRIFGTTSFADEVMVGTIRAMGRDRTPPEMPLVPQPQQISDNEVKIVWEMNSMTEKDLLGFNVGRGNSSDGEFRCLNATLLPPSGRVFTDSTFSKDSPNFYVVEAIDTAKNVSRSYPAYVALNDTTPPIRPQWIRGEMDSNGVVTLVLKRNHEKDFMGFRILRANSPEHEFSSIIENYGNENMDYSGDTLFKDTVSLISTTKFVYYSATSLDFRYNESPMSEILAIRRYDKVPPVTPVFKEVNVTEKSVSLKFAPGTGEDVKYQVLFRKKQGQDQWDTIAFLTSFDSLYRDDSVIQNITYEYALQAVDSSGLRSPLSASVLGRPYYSGILPPVTNLTAAYDSGSQMVTIRWDFKKQGKPCYFMIYRSYNEDGLTQYARQNDDSINFFVDPDINKGKGRYEYGIKVFNTFGGESKLSEKAGVQVK